MARVLTCVPGDYSRFSQDLKPRVVKDEAGRAIYVKSEAFLLLRKLHKLKFVVRHRSKMNEQKIYTVKEIMFAQEYGAEGAISTNVTFNKKTPDGKQKETSVYDHYKEQYNFRLQHAKLPIIETTRGAYFPMELCNVADYQRYPFKLDPDQVSYI